MMTAGSSAHPVDRLIRRVIRTSVQPTSTEVQEIIRRIAAAPFSRRLVTVDPRYIGLAADHGFSVPRQTDALTAHVAKHVRAQQQWAATTEAEYLHDVQTAIVSPGSHLVLFEQKRRPVAAVVALTTEVVPVERIGQEYGSVLLVVYSPDNAMIVTAYMVADMTSANIPVGATWLT